MWQDHEKNSSIFYSSFTSIFSDLMIVSHKTCFRSITIQGGDARTKQHVFFLSFSKKISTIISKHITSCETCAINLYCKWSKVLNEAERLLIHKKLLEISSLVEVACLIVFCAPPCSIVVFQCYVSGEGAKPWGRYYSPSSFMCQSRPCNWWLLLKLELI